MCKGLNKLFLCTLMSFIVSCVSADDRTLSPPLNTAWVNIEIKNPSAYTKPFPLEVLYVSTTCKRELMSLRDVQHYEKVGYNPVKIPLQKQSDSDIWVAKIAKDGGGKCNWQLSEFNLGIEYIDATHLGKGLVPGTAVGATIAFDDNATKNGLFKTVHGDINLSPIYYPYIRERRLNSTETSLSLLGEKSFISLKADGTNKFSFHPRLDETKVTRYIGVAKKEPGSYAKIIYPDGIVAPEGTIIPDFNKINAK
ncbi:MULTISPECIES: hypothetical protein [Enterobacter]|uniref:hypothetical protein n=1 Tax=Enterobacter TaxID=547 RepID=UPI0028EF3E13|nr:hypothetical protein [Enterobacter cloacae]WNT35288.1 hypothetical protein RRL13_16060 [Enterobacter cloacae]HDR2792013.1 hypothetical protein [Enterobacter asburiae]HDR2800077.1 hypothetical protein [Enterobacter asburiae]